MSRRSAPFTGASSGSTLFDERRFETTGFLGAAAVVRAEAGRCAVSRLPREPLEGPVLFFAARLVGVALLRAAGRATGFLAADVFLILAGERCAFFAMWSRCQSRPKLVLRHRRIVMTHR
jgi:hypothetical protein